MSSGDSGRRELKSFAFLLQSHLHPDWNFLYYVPDSNIIRKSRPLLAVLLRYYFQT